MCTACCCLRVSLLVKIKIQKSERASERASISSGCHVCLLGNGTHRRGWGRFYAVGWPKCWVWVGLPVSRLAVPRRSVLSQPQNSSAGISLLVFWFFSYSISFLSLFFFCIIFRVVYTGWFVFEPFESFVRLLAETNAWLLCIARWPASCPPRDRRGPASNHSLTETLLHLFRGLLC